jgi:hypothetical protein
MLHYGGLELPAMRVVQACDRSSTREGVRLMRRIYSECGDSELSEDWLGGGELLRREPDDEEDEEEDDHKKEEEDDDEETEDGYSE